MRFWNNNPANQERPPIEYGASPASRKSLFGRLRPFLIPLKRSEKRVIENERHPSWVSFVTIFLPVAVTFHFFRQFQEAPD